MVSRTLEIALVNAILVYGPEMLENANMVRILRNFCSLTTVTLVIKKSYLYVIRLISYTLGVFATETH